MSAPAHRVRYKSDVADGSLQPDRPGGLVARFKYVTLSSARRRTVSAATVLLLHLIVLWALTAGIRPGPVIVETPELQVSVVSPGVAPPSAPAPPLAWHFEAPPEADIAEPKIDVAPDPGAAPLTATSSSQVLPPRPEPGFLNPSPDVPYALRQIAATAAIVLRLYVLANGMVAEARIQKSSSNNDLDRIAMDYVKANWHFIPASRGGRPVEDWMTVMFRFHL